MKLGGDNDSRGEESDDLTLRYKSYKITSSQLPAPPKNLEAKITFEDIENEIEQNLVEIRTLYERLQDLNKDLGWTLMQKDFLKAVERLKLESHFKFVGKEEARRLISKWRH